MPLRGETVGTAYVRILADGSGLGRSIKDEMAAHEGDMETAGEEHSKAYNRGFEAEQERNKGMEKGLEKSFDRAFGKVQARADTMSRGLEEKIAGHLNKGLLDGLDPDLAKEVGRRAAKNIADEFSRTGTIRRGVQGLSDEIDKALKEIERESSDFEKKFRRDMNAVTQDFFRTASDIGDTAKRMQSAFDSVGTAVGRIRVDAAKDADRVIRSVGKGSEEAEPHVGKLRARLDEFGDSFGKVFGKGSRNNFVNFIGSFASAPIKALGAVVGAFEDAGKHIQQVFTEAGGGVSGFGAVALDLGKSGAVGLGVLAGIVTIAGPVIGAISSIAAALTALASSVSFALAGGLGVLAGLLPVVAFGLGTVALAFVGMSSDAKKALTASIKPFVDEFKGMRKVAQEGILAGINTAAPILAKALKGITPLIKDISDAIGDVIIQFAKAADSPGFQKFIKAMDGFIPDAIRKLGRSAKNTLGGIGGIFEGLIPSTKRFLDWLDKITQKFSDWANSPKGQNQIKDFMDKATDSGKKLWDLVKQIGVSLGLLLFGDSGKKAGDSIIVDLTDQVKSFNDWLKAHPGALKQWFADGKDMAEKIGTTVKRIIQIFDELDTPQNRALANNTIGAFNLALKAVPAIFALSGIPEMVTIFGAIKTAAIAMKNGVRNAFADMVDSVLGKISTMLHGAARMTSWYPPLHNKLQKAADDFDQWKDRVNASIRGVKPVNIPVKITGGQAAIDEIATLRWELEHIPKSVTVTVLNKVQHIPVSASGGIFAGAQVRVIGEAGPEAVVPLNRPLAQVDPAVRALSAAAQGKTTTTTNNNGRTVNVGGLTVVTPTKDPAAVAHETVNQLVAASYI